MSGEVQLLINTPLGKKSQYDDYAHAARRDRLIGVAYTTTLSAANAACDAIRAALEGAVCPLASGVAFAVPKEPRSRWHKPVHSRVGVRRRRRPIGADTKVWHFCHVLGGAVIGERCSLGQNVVVMNGVKIGNNVKIQNNVSVYEGVELEDDVFCGPSMVFTNVINPRSHVSAEGRVSSTLSRAARRSARTRRSSVG